MFRLIPARARTLAQEDGAVTVDWVVLTAAAGFLSVAALAGMSDSVTGIGALVANYLREVGESQLGQ
ncbi:hypothetical protein V8J36_09550 [Frigidibacter sp. MR17.14]|uniref:hypothetical protein n=1 Tax=Frigidibacter sp. MR17.14 TaxID=3126509 RepID=UPI003012F243